MNPAPRFQADIFIHENIEELQVYARVFHDRIVKARVTTQVLFDA